MPPLFETVTDLHSGAEVLRRRRYGVIEMVDGQLHSVRLRPFPAVSTWATYYWGRWCHARRPGNRCLLYYNQPRHFPQFIALRYLQSARDTRPATVFGALEVLDEIARLKGVDALLCDVANGRISDRLLARRGWTVHAPSRWHRNFIKRFERPAPLRPSMSLEELSLV